MTAEEPEDGIADTPDKWVSPATTGTEGNGD